MKLRELEAFRAILQTNSVTAAAALLRLTQPQVSRLILSLEAECGFALFVRQNQRLVPTAEAQAFYIEAERLLRGFDEVKDAAGRIRERQSSHIRIVTSQPIAAGLISPAIRQFSERNANASFSIEMRSKVEIEFRMAQLHFDLGVATLPIHHTEVDVEHFATRDAVIVLPQGHPLEKEAVIDLASLEGEPIITNHKGSFLRNHLDRAFADAGLVPTIRVETALSGFACVLASEGIGIGFADPVVAAGHVGKGISIRAAKPALTIRYAFVLPRWQPVASATRDFIEQVVGVEAGLPRV